MADYKSSMRQSFEYYMVDPGTWKDTKLLTTIKSCTINRDSGVDTLGSATIGITESVGECYIRVYLVIVQNGITEKIPLGTFLVQTPSSNFDGKIRNVSMDAYTPLLELKENQPPIGYYVPKSDSKNGTGYYEVECLYTYTLTSETIETVTGTIVENATTTTKEQVYLYESPDGENVYYCELETGFYKVERRSSYVITTKRVEIITGSIRDNLLTTTGEQIYFGKTSEGNDVYYCVIESFMNIAYRLTRENARAPVVKAECPDILKNDFVANTNDSWFSFLSDLIATAKYEFALDELGRILFAPIQDTASLQPVWTYDDDNSSILYPELNMEHDLYGIPNVVEVIYFDGKNHYYAKVVNDDENSPTSTVRRGRNIVYRDTSPSLIGIPTQGQIDEYAEQLLRNLSSVEYTITYTHGYCPVRLGDCVRLNYRRAGLTDIKAKVVSQTIKCTPGCPVTETAVFTTKLWG